MSLIVLDHDNAHLLLQNSLRESESLFYALADATPVMMWIAGTDMMSTFFNKAWLNFRGQTLKEEIGHDWIEGLAPQDMARCWGIYMKAFASRQKFMMNFRLKGIDGVYRWVTASGAPRFTSDRKFLGFIGWCSDITESK